MAEACKGQPKSPARRLLNAVAHDGSTPVVGRATLEVHRYPKAAAFLAMLRSHTPNPDADFGEHEAIALCKYVFVDHRFVTMDKKALAAAVNALGGRRVAYPFELADDLEARQALSGAEGNRLRSLIRKKDPTIPHITPRT